MFTCLQVACTLLKGSIVFREQGVGSREQGVGSREQGAGSKEQGENILCLFVPFVRDKIYRYFFCYAYISSNIFCNFAS